MTKQGINGIPRDIRCGRNNYDMEQIVISKAD